MKRLKIATHTIDGTAWAFHATKRRSHRHCVVLVEFATIRHWQIVARGPTASLLYSLLAYMAGQPNRPFYGEYAWAFDLLIDRPVGQECAAITAWLSDRGVLPGATLLDAGCGTGRYARELARRGYVVEGVDQSSELIETASHSIHGDGSSVSFRVGDILALSAARYDGVLCRGVLNDFVNDDARVSVFDAFAGALRRPGVLILDVREWEATKDRKQREPVFRKSVTTDRGRLTFTSTTELDPENQQLLLSETHALVNDAGEHSRDYRFVMRCWTRTELESVLKRSGFGAVAYFGAYDPAVHAGATDRLIAVAQLSDVSSAR